MEPYKLSDYANDILARFKGQTPSLADVDRLTNMLKDVLVKEFGVSYGKIV